MKRFIYVVSIGLCTLGISCKKFVDVKAPNNSLNSENVYTSDATAASVLTNIYTKITQASLTNASGSVTSLSLLPGLSSDEFKLSYTGNITFGRYYSNSLTSSVPAISLDYWNVFYPIIFSANAAIEGLVGSQSLTPAVKQQLLGEAKFIRAFSYFYLVNLYGDVPLAISSDWQVNSTLPRSPKSDIYQQIVSDLKDAESLLSDSYLKADALTAYPAGSEERVRPTKWAAAAMLSRTYLYTGDWANAETEATTVINNPNLYDTVALGKTFLKNNKEAIWQFQPVNTGWNTEDARTFVITTGFSAAKPVSLSPWLLSAFDPADQRKTNWTKSITISSVPYSFPNKYKVATINSPVTEYQTVLRLAELYLIRAEAKTQEGKINEAQADLNVIRQRARLSPTTANDKPSLLAAILKERQVEYFSEWGHRWLDLKRTGNVDAVISAITSQKGGTWETTDQFYSIPIVELQRDLNLVQNQGY